MRSLPLAIMSLLAFGGEAIDPRSMGLSTRGGRRGKWGHRGQYGKELRRRRARNKVAKAERQRQRRAARA